MFLIKKIPKSLFIWVAIIAVLLVSLAVYAFWIEPRRLIIRQVTISISGLKSPIRAVLIGDPQPVKPYWPSERIRWAMNQAQKQKPDIVFFVGDYAYEPSLLKRLGLAKGLLVNPAETVAATASIKSPMGSYAVLGNHDWWWNGPAMIRLLKQTPIHLLKDQAILVQDKKRALWIAGLEDMSTPRPYDLSGTLNQTNRTAPIILLSHSPDVFPSVPKTVALTLAGHTHGGQVYLPFIGRPIVPIHYKRYAYGHFNEQGRQLFVTAGIGTSILPIRFLCPPEIVVLNLVPLLKPVAH